MIPNMSMNGTTNQNAHLENDGFPELPMKQVFTELEWIIPRNFENELTNWISAACASCSGSDRIEIEGRLMKNTSCIQSTPQPSAGEAHIHAHPSNIQSKNRDKIMSWLMTCEAWPEVNRTVCHDIHSHNIRQRSYLLEEEWKQGQGFVMCPNTTKKEFIQKKVLVQVDLLCDMAPFYIRIEISKEIQLNEDDWVSEEKHTSQRLKEMISFVSPHHTMSGVLRMDVAEALVLQKPMQLDLLSTWNQSSGSYMEYPSYASKRQLAEMATHTFNTEHQWSMIGCPEKIMEHILSRQLTDKCNLAHMFCAEAEWVFPSNDVHGKYADHAMIAASLIDGLKSMLSMVMIVREHPIEMRTHVSQLNLQ